MEQLTFEERAALEQIKQRWRNSKDESICAMAAKIDAAPIETQRAVMNAEHFANEAARWFYDLELDVRDGSMSKEEAKGLIEKFNSNLTETFLLLLEKDKKK